MTHFLNESLPEETPDESTTPGIKQIGEFPPTDEQSAIILAGIESKDNLIVKALAGAAKTSTLVMLANQPKMMKHASLCLSFNKKIADEMRARLPSICVSMTLNAPRRS